MRVVTEERAELLRYYITMGDENAPYGLQTGVDGPLFTATAVRLEAPL
jgi:uncharacterized protein YfeS